MRDLFKGIALVAIAILLLAGILMMLTNDDGTVNLLYAGDLFGGHAFSYGKSYIYCENPKNIELVWMHSYRIRQTGLFSGVVEGKN